MHRASPRPLLQNLHPLRHTTFVRCFSLFCSLRRRLRDLEILVTGIELLLLRRVQIEVLLQVGSFAVFAKAIDDIPADGAIQCRDEAEECAVVSHKAVVLAQPSRLAEAALSWVELRRRARAHRNLHARPLRGATATTNIARATVARFRLRKG